MEGFKRIRDPYRRRYIALALDRVRGEFGRSLVSFVLYGSVARGDDDKKSDIDVLSILDTDKIYGERCGILGKILVELYKTDLAQMMMDLGYNIFIEFYPLNVQEALTFRPLYLDMVNDAVILYDKDDFFKKILIKVSGTLSKFGSRRIWLNEREWIWIIKPDIKFGEEVSYEFE